MSLAISPSWIAARDRLGAARASSPAAATGCGRSASSERIRPALAHHARREVEVVVVEEDGASGMRSSSASTAVSEARVDGDVALRPRAVKRGVDPRCVREIPERVLEEPEHRVRDDVVVPVVRLSVVRDEAQPVGRAVARGLLERVAPASAARSSSVIALAIQVTSWCCTRLRSAVTSPPPPRRGRAPSASRPYDTGPRFETTISLRRIAHGIRLGCDDRRSRHPRCRSRAAG